MAQQQPSSHAAMYADFGSQCVREEENFIPFYKRNIMDDLFQFFDDEDNMEDFVSSFADSFAHFAKMKSRDPILSHANDEFYVEVSNAYEWLFERLNKTVLQLVECNIRHTPAQTSCRPWRQPTEDDIKRYHEDQLRLRHAEEQLSRASGDSGDFESMPNPRISPTTNPQPRVGQCRLPSSCLDAPPSTLSPSIKSTPSTPNKSRSNPPSIILTRITDNVLFVRDVLFEEWDSWCHEVFGLDQIPLKFQISNIDQVARKGNSSITISFYERPKRSLIEHFVETAQRFTRSCRVNVFEENYVFTATNIKSSSRLSPTIPSALPRKQHSKSESFLTPPRKYPMQQQTERSSYYSRRNYIVKSPWDAIKQHTSPQSQPRGSPWFRLSKLESKLDLLATIFTQQLGWLK